MPPWEARGARATADPMRTGLEWPLRWCKIGPPTKQNTTLTAGFAKWKVAEPEL